MSFIFKRTAPFVEWLTSYRTMLGLLLPLSLWWLIITAQFGVEAEIAASSRTFQVFYLLLLCSVAIRLLKMIRLRKADYSALCSGYFLLLLSGMFWYGFCFSGTFELGKGESFSRYQSVGGPKWGAPPLLPVTLASAPSQNFGKTVVFVNGKLKELPAEGHIFWKWFSVGYLGESMAPFLLIDEAIGEEDKAGFVRLPLEKERPPYFTFGTLPHRFYLSLSDKGESLKNGVTPGSLRVRIMRGKINVLTKDVKLGEIVRFEGHSLRFENGSPWVRLEVKDLRAWYLFFAGILLSVVGCSIILIQRSYATPTTQKQN